MLQIQSVAMFSELDKIFSRVLVSALYYRVLEIHTLIHTIEM